jgi:hypothetical protein
MSEFVQVRMPSGQAVWVRAADADDGPKDVNLGATAVELVQLPGFTETVQGVITSVRGALQRYRPDTVAVEFGIELNARTGRVLSVLAEAGAKTHIKVTATWGAAGPPVAAVEQATDVAPHEAAEAGS